MTLVTSTEAYAKLEAKMKEYDEFGACDSEGYYALERLENAIKLGNPFPFVHRDTPLARFIGFNPFSLYESKPGWETASTELIHAAQV